MLDAALAHGARGAAPTWSWPTTPTPIGWGSPCPTADRGGWRALSGNEIGALLADHLLRHTTGADRLVVATLVSSRLVERLAAGGRRALRGHADRLQVDRPARARPPRAGASSSATRRRSGSRSRPAVRDKDGIAAALVFAELTAELRAAGSSPLHRLAELASATASMPPTSGRSASRTGPRGRPGGGADGRVRARPPRPLGGRRLAEVRDLRDGGDLPPADVVIWDLDDGTRVVFRPSGTEPKLKVYLEVVRRCRAG